MKPSTHFTVRTANKSQPPETLDKLASTLGMFARAVLHRGINARRAARARVD